MKLHRYARAKRAYVEAEHALAANGATLDTWTLGVIVAVVGELLDTPVFAKGVLSTTTFQVVAGNKRTRDFVEALLRTRRGELAGVRLLLREDGSLGLQNAERPFGSPEADMPSCLQCGAVVEDLLCDGCFDESFPPTSEEEASHRSRVRHFLAHGRVLSTEALWRKVRELVEAHLPALTADFSRAVPLALHRSGFFCATAGTDERCGRPHAPCARGSAAARAAPGDGSRLPHGHWVRGRHAGLRAAVLLHHSPPAMSAQGPLHPPSPSALHSQVAAFPKGSPAQLAVAMAEGPVAWMGR